MAEIEKDSTKNIFKQHLTANEAKRSVFLGSQPDRIGSEIEIIRGLSAENTLERMEKRLTGKKYDYSKKKWVDYRTPVMNELGIGNFMATCQSLSDNANFSNYKEKEINRYVELFFRQNYPTFTVYHQEFELSPKDFNIIKSCLLFYSLSILKNALNAGHRNAVRGTLSESVFLRAMATSNKEEKKEGFLNKYFGKKK